MPSQSSKPTLHLVVDHDRDDYCNWKIASLQVDQGEIIRPGEDSEYANATPGIHSLACLVAHQAYLRRLKQDYIKLPPARHTHLKTLWEAAKGATPNWQRDLFTIDPFPSYISSRGGRKHFDVWFADEINLRVESTISEEELPAKALLDLRNHLTTPKKTLEPKVVIEVLRGRSPISTEALEGALIFGDEIQIQARANFSAEVAMYWISSRSSINQLFPHLDIPIEKEASPFDLTPNGDGFSLTIPDKTTFQVNSLKGIETCLLLLRNKAFSKEESLSIQEIIEKSLTPESKTTQLFDPTFKPISLQEPIVQEVADTRLGPSQKLTQWENHLHENLRGFGTTLYLFHIPNL